MTARAFVPGGAVTANRIQVVDAPGPYVYFALSAFALTLLGGPIIGVILWAARGGLANPERQPALIQAHGWTQLAGWAGLFVAGFSLRLLPRFAGRPEKAPGISMVLLGALVSGVVLRLVGLALWPSAAGIAVIGEVILAAGILGVSGRQLSILKGNRNAGAPWAWFAFMGATWWGTWAVLTIAGAAASGGSGVVPYGLDRASVWAVTLGAIGNFIWAVQSRMMPVSFGKAAVTRKAVLVPIAAYNLGAATALLASLAPYSDHLLPAWPLVRAGGLGLAGGATIWLAWSCGALGGKAERLRPASQPLARFIVWANRWAAAGGLLLLLLPIRGLLPVAIARLDLEDAALHAIEAGLVTMLIAGMLQLVAPVFAMERMGRRPQERFTALVWTLLMTATLTRVVGALIPAWFTTLAGVSGLSGWLGLALLARALVAARGAPTARRPAGVSD